MPLRIYNIIYNRNRSNTRFSANISQKDDDGLETFLLDKALAKGQQQGIIRKDIFNINVDDLRKYQQVVFLAGLSNNTSEPRIRRAAFFCPSNLCGID